MDTYDEATMSVEQVGERHAFLKENPFVATGEVIRMETLDRKYFGWEGSV